MSSLVLSPVIRRVIYVVTYEVVAVVFVTFALTWLGHAGGSAGLTAVVTSTIALLWNFTWTSLFEAWERRQASQKRTVLRRVAHAVGFETGLIFMLVPVMAWLLGVSLWEAFVLDIGLIVFFFIYTFVFAWVFDLLVPPRGELAK